MPLTGRICTKSVNVHRVSPVHGCPGQSGNSLQVNSLRLIPGAVQQSLSHLPAVSCGVHFLQRLPDAQISPDDVVPWLQNTTRAGTLRMPYCENSVGSI